MTSPRGGGEAEARAVLRSHGCCMEDYGFIGDADVIAEGRAEYDRLLDTYRTAVRAAYREEVMAMVDSLRKPEPGYATSPNHQWNAALDTLAQRLTPRPTEDG